MMENNNMRPSTSSFNALLIGLFFGIYVGGRQGIFLGIVVGILVSAVGFILLKKLDDILNKAVAAAEEADRAKKEAEAAEKHGQIGEASEIENEDVKPDINNDDPVIQATDKEEVKEEDKEQ